MTIEKKKMMMMTMRKEDDDKDGIVHGVCKINK